VNDSVLEGELQTGKNIRDDPDSATIPGEHPENIREDPVFTERIRGFIERNGGLHANEQGRGECPPDPIRVGVLLMSPSRKKRMADCERRQYEEDLPLVKELLIEYLRSDAGRQRIKELSQDRQAHPGGF
jgi:hypothetical protein